MSLTVLNQSITFSYTGGVQTFTPAVSGTYKLEVYGAQGGNSLKNGSSTGSGGQGGISSGEIYLEAGQTIYICVGGAGATGVKNGTAKGGYNGGGSGSSDGSDDEASGGGGGCTHIAYVTGTLAEIGASNKSQVLIVAGGGGGKSYTYTPGTGGGVNGGTSSSTSSSYPTQTSGYAFGQGQNGSGAADSDGVAGGGGGWYGGYANNVAAKSCGTGGSGYIGGVENGTTSNGGNTGNGKATITLIGLHYGIYLGNKCKTMYIGNQEVQQIFFGTKELRVK